MMDFLFNLPYSSEFIGAVTGTNKIMREHLQSKFSEYRRRGLDSESAFVLFYMQLGSYDPSYPQKMDQFIEDWCKKRRSGERNG